MRPVLTTGALRARPWLRWLLPFRVHCLRCQARLQRGRPAGRGGGRPRVSGGRRMLAGVLPRGGISAWTTLHLRCVRPLGRRPLWRPSSGGACAPTWRRRGPRPAASSRTTRSRRPSPGRSSWRWAGTLTHPSTRAAPARAGGGVRHRVRAGAPRRRPSGSRRRGSSPGSDPPSPGGGRRADASRPAGAVALGRAPAPGRPARPLVRARSARGQRRAAPRGARHPRAAGASGRASPDARRTCGACRPRRGPNASGGARRHAPRPHLCKLTSAL